MTFPWPPGELPTEDQARAFVGAAGLYSDDDFRAFILSQPVGRVPGWRIAAVAAVILGKPRLWTREPGDDDNAGRFVTLEDALDQVAVGFIKLPPPDPRSAEELWQDVQSEWRLDRLEVAGRALRETIRRLGPELELLREEYRQLAVAGLAGADDVARGQVVAEHLRWARSAVVDIDTAIAREKWAMEARVEGRGTP